VGVLEHMFVLWCSTTFIDNLSDEPVYWSGSRTSLLNHLQGFLMSQYWSCCNRRSAKPVNVNVIMGELDLLSQSKPISINKFTGVCPSTALPNDTSSNTSTNDQ